MKNKTVFRLTESELREMIENSTRKIISELDWKTYANAAKANDTWRKEHPNHRAHQWNRSEDFRNMAADKFREKYGLENQYDGNDWREKGTINLNSYDDFSVTGTRDHDFGDENPHRLNHNVYHMGKNYGVNGGYGRTRMWDFAHDTTPEEFYGSDEMGKKFRDAEKEAEDYNSGKLKYIKSNDPKVPSKWGYNESNRRFGSALNEAIDPTSKIQALIQQANDAYHEAVEMQGGDEMPLMDKYGTPYGLSGDIRLDGRGYVIIPFANGGSYTEYSRPIKIRVLGKVGGKVKVIQGDYFNEGWKDVKKILNKIIKDANIGNGMFKNYDPNWETSETPEEYKTNRQSLRNMNKQIGRNASSGMDSLGKNY